MMRERKKRVLLLGVSIGLVVMFFLFGPVGLTGRAQGAPEMILITFTDTDPTQYTDPSGTVILGEGLHMGELRCVGEVCTQKITFEPFDQGTDPIVYEYKFKSRQAFDPEAQKVIVTGGGTIDNGGPKSKFSFTGTFQNNGDDTLFVRYDASRPDASFIFPAAPGTFSVISNN